ncbi:DUF1304 domain-containing protein [Marinilactibacillus sp. GCM10026970]|uniref:DUF1304 domain-containing protein n=1 Tax=Marinilactibacillus sp. GCM10026970 TaxID=3252642 RepID=UPI0036207CCB
MSILSIVLTTVVALEFFYIFYIQTLTTTSSTTSRIFNIDHSELKQKSMNTLLKNQGVYNGLIGLGLLYSIFFATASLEMTRFILIYIILVALYGSITSSKKIILTQGGPAIIALITTLF